jgi:hypothetical protein
MSNVGGLPTAPVTRPEQEPDAMWMVIDRRRVTAAILKFQTWTQLGRTG